ncbi:MAG: hypothetical protein A3J04_04170 [Candidatus Ryanbacteria bacterium RIFCSPLOWO2_02_FULL_47_14]|uniref:DUF86 domain-containing protein n=1 Tax=Candidatus Ryanbacteria bacterium RIFCSPLOWO2_02_FULL_47_14 TaxID=1802129 RepID=A0A1G2GZR3_9BACT|nr:MAG: hypothetical protein A3J04_04170 [Candidatus Ryanbacteria bacterium RIFCSPLOWO2_02_FULL_47_14]
MISQEIVKRKIDDIQLCYSKIEKLLVNEDEVILRDGTILAALERHFQKMVDAAIDINMHLIAESGLKTADDYQSTFSIIAEAGMLPVDFALKIAPSVGMRNAIVHQYGDVNKKLMISYIRNSFGQYVEYVKLIDAFLKKQK